MKKILSLFILYLVCAIPTFAVISTDDTTSDEYITNHGYSSEMARLIDLQNKQINGEPSNYKRNEPEWWYTNKPVNFIRNTFIYLDPVLDDGKFMQHDIKYSNGFNNL